MRLRRGILGRVVMPIAYHRHRSRGHATAKARVESTRRTPCSHPSATAKLVPGADCVHPSWHGFCSFTTCRLTTEAAHPLALRTRFQKQLRLSWHSTPAPVSTAPSSYGWDLEP
uniref:Uncharacterized protein n=1 Tax=Physcomitrium patens TaxID=3218 RepID=A0A2K1L496_PHYPA|nr:hypothetical protein PHYPA_003642 [Physcomitrium patens]